jgi:hypothetical protein
MFRNREDFISMDQFNDFLHRFKRHEDEEKRHTWMWVGIILSSVAVIAAIAYCIYRYLTPNYLEDFDEDFDLDFDDEDYEEIEYDDEDFDDYEGEEIAEAMMENEIKE